MCLASGGVPACGGAGPATVTITIAPTPSTVNVSLVAFRDGLDGAWQPATATAAGRYEITVHGPYTVADVCVTESAVFTRETSRTMDDLHELDLSCEILYLYDQPTSPVLGTMAQAGYVLLGNRLGFTFAGDLFEIDSPDGTYDLVAVIQSQDPLEPPRVVIRRDVIVAGPTTLSPAIDADREGIGSFEVPLTVTNRLTNETVSASSDLQTPTTGAGLGYSDPAALAVALLPDATLQPGDSQHISVSGFGGSATRSIHRKVTQGSSTEFALPPAFASQIAVASDQLTATWDVLAPYDKLTLQVRQVAPDGSSALFHRRELSASYLAAAGDTSARFDTDLPGYDPAWRGDFTGPWDYSYIASSVGADGADVLRTSVGLILTGPVIGI
jgi:hypothetical protein